MGILPQNQAEQTRASKREFLFEKTQLAAVKTEGKMSENRGASKAKRKEVDFQIYDYRH